MYKIKIYFLFIMFIHTFCFANNNEEHVSHWLKGLQAHSSDKYKDALIDGEFYANCVEPFSRLKDYIQAPCDPMYD